MRICLSVCLVEMWTFECISRNPRFFVCSPEYKLSFFMKALNKWVSRIGEIQSLSLELDYSSKSGLQRQHLPSRVSLLSLFVNWTHRIRNSTSLLAFVKGVSGPEAPFPPCGTTVPRTQYDTVLWRIPFWGKPTLGWARDPASIVPLAWEVKLGFPNKGAEICGPLCNPASTDLGLKSHFILVWIRWFHKKAPQ